MSWVILYHNVSDRLESIDPFDNFLKDVPQDNHFSILLLDLPSLSQALLPFYLCGLKHFL